MQSHLLALILGFGGQLAAVREMSHVFLIILHPGLIHIIENVPKDQKDRLQFTSDFKASAYVSIINV